MNLHSNIKYFYQKKLYTYLFKIIYTIIPLYKNTK